MSTRFVEAAMKLCSCQLCVVILLVTACQARIDDHEALANALEDLEMSTITKPNEEAMITARGVFGIWQWDVLPPELQQLTIADLVTVRPPDANPETLK
jgi:hypothetical protein